MSERQAVRSNPREIVLVVDDSPATLGMLTDTLETVGVTVLISPGGEHAIQLVDKVTPDIVLMDAIMPGLDGFETCRRLKARRDFKHVPVIFMTGLSATEHIVRALEAGGVDYLTKPVVPDELIARMQVHLANARMTRSAQTALDDSRRYLMAVDIGGRVLWSTPEAARLLESEIGGLSVSAAQLASPVCHWLEKKLGIDATTSGYDHIVPLGEERKLIIGFLGEASRGEHLIRIVEHDLDKDRAILAKAFDLTQRETEVAIWLSHGKSNKEIAEILGVSPRTVNKHLEPVFIKLGVENRTSAATVVLRALSAG